MKFILIVFIALATAGYAHAQDTILSTMQREADTICHVKVLELRGGEMEEQGVQQFSALCQLVEPLQGVAKGERSIRIRFDRFVTDAGEEPMPLQVGEAYVVLLKGTQGTVRFESDQQMYPAHTLLDRWVGIMPYEVHLVDRLKRLASAE